MHKDEYILDEVNQFCSEIGSNALLVQGAGGNVSFKDDSTLWVKASGTSLAEALDKDIFVPVDLHKIRVHIKNNNFSYKPESLNNTDLKPSIETLLHALMHQKIVVHLHAVDILSYLVRKDLSEMNKNIDGVESAIIDYHKPGKELAMAVNSAINSNKKINVIFMKNHGIVFAASNMKEIKNILNILLVSFKPRINEEYYSIEHISNEKAFNEIGYKRCLNLKINTVIINKNYINRLKNDWSLCPDHVVFLGGNACIISSEKNLKNVLNISPLPPYIFVENKGVFESNNLIKAQEQQMICYCDLVFRQQAHDKLDSLSVEQVADLIDWDAEKYRRKLLNL
jgi:rhamnose utilization protein RhaD (predicted bifunctional aldolase and dehydrogenase)